MDAGLSAFVALAVVCIAVAYAVRLAATGRARHARVDAEGSSALVPKGAMEMFYWSLQPLASVCARVGVAANTITWLSLVFAALACAALATGHFGLGAALAIVSAAGDALDGLVARHTKTDSAAGEILDATVDRYVEVLLLAGIAIRLRAGAWELALAPGA
jgi:CDP-diacylglycerol--glycerol-3-phosphate 3-phosphatidyltransferase